MKQGNHKGCETAIAERQLQAFRLRKAGHSYREIARECGVSLKTAFTDVGSIIQELTSLTKEEAESVRQMELAKLDDMEKALDWRINIGKDTQAVHTRLRVMERRAKLLGLDAPTEVKVLTSDSPQAKPFLAEFFAAVELLDLTDGQREVLAVRLEKFRPASERALPVTITQE